MSSKIKVRSDLCKKNQNDFKGKKSTEPSLSLGKLYNFLTIYLTLS